jgi:sigma-B regulation protein RsbU (phosphoserine phosphatase)
VSHNTVVQSAETLRILLLEDSRPDAELIETHLTEACPFAEVTRVSNRAEFQQALLSGNWQLILSDYNVPGYDGSTALSESRTARPDVPFIFVSGAIGEERAIELLRRGATDYVLKDHLERLAPSVDRALKEAKEREVRRTAQEQLRVSEERSRALIAALTEGVILQDASGEIREANASAQRLLGRQLVDLVGRGAADPSWDLVNEDGSPVGPSEAPAMETLRSGVPVVDRVLGVRRPDGRLVWLSVNSQPLFAQDGTTVISVVSSFSDVSERKKRAEFEQQLIGIVSHDLRNPLHSISLSAQLMVRQENLDQRATKGIRRILANTDRANRMIRDLLDFTQARLGGGIPLVIRPLDMHEHVAMLMEELQQVHPERELILTCNGDMNGHWDPDRTAQLFGNLISNALAYSSKEDVVRVSLGGDSDAVTLSVNNGGSVIAPERMRDLFKPMTRGVSKADFQTRSIGLGLYIVEQIAHGHGGTVSVQSSVEEGTTFAVRLPRVRGAPVAAVQSSG